MKNIIDISKHQGSYSPKGALAAGIDNVIMRCAYSTTKDIRFDEFAQAAVDAGQAVGVYGFATWHYTSNNGGDYNTALALADKQTAAWLSYCADKQIDGYFVIDQELESGKTMGLTPSQNEALLNHCIAKIKAAGYVPLVYCSASWAMSQFDWQNLDADLWLAYYYADPNDPDFGAVPDYKTKTGKYFAFMQSLGDKIAGWQFGRIGYGNKYGVASDNIDRNIFYKTPAADPIAPPLSDEPVCLKMGAASMGDLLTIEQKLTALLIPFATDAGFITTCAPVSGGDQMQLAKLCAKLGIPCVIFYGDILTPDTGNDEDPSAPEPEVNPEQPTEPEAEEAEPEVDTEEAESTSIIDRVLKAFFDWLSKYFNKGE